VCSHTAGSSLQWRPGQPPSGTPLAWRTELAGAAPQAQSGRQMSPVSQRASVPGKTRRGPQEYPRVGREELRRRSAQATPTQQKYRAHSSRTSREQCPIGLPQTKAVHAARMRVPRLSGRVLL